MDKGAIKKFAVEARRKLISEITYKASLLGITENGIAEPLPQSTSDMLFLDIGTASPAKVQGTEVAQRAALVRVINTRAAGSNMKSAFESVVEEVAYTWFNRLIAIRFMEVNDYLPSGIRVLSSAEPSKTEPDIVTTPFDTDLDFTPYEKDRIVELKDQNKSDELFRLLFIKQCNKLREILPQLFEATKDYSELLLTLSFTNKDSVVYMLTHDISEDDFNVEKQGQVEIIGWLYQYYISEKHEEVVDPLHGKTVKKEDIPAATQLFTTDWVVRYLVDNSVGRYWIERNSGSHLRDKLEYFVTPKSGEINYINEKITPQDVSVFDPCVGSGHFLVYAFDILMEIYQECGYIERDAVSNIVKHNLFGIDIDNRAAQLAYFAVMMKARQYDRRFLTCGISPNIYTVTESADISRDVIDYFINGDKTLETNLTSLLDDFKDAKEYGSLINVTPVDFTVLYARCDEIIDDISIFKEQALNEILPFLRVAEVLSKKYAAVTTNPPYLNKYDAKLKTFINDNYADYKGDLFSVFMYRNFGFCKENGYSGFMTPLVWMFIKTYESLRRYILAEKSFVSLIQFEYSAFEEATVPICSFILKNGKETAKGLYFRLVDFRGGMEIQKQKMLEALSNKDCGYFYEATEENFSKIPGSPIAYWVSDRFYDNYLNGKLSDISEIITGMTIGDNNKYLRQWYEVSFLSLALNKKNMEEIDIAETKWIPYSKGGMRRNWYGNYDFIVDWSQKQHFNRSKTTLQHLYLRDAITWPFITSGDFSARILPNGFLWDVAGSPCFFNNEFDKLFALGFLCSKVTNYTLKIVNPTINIQAVDLAMLPLLKCSTIEKEKICNIVKNSINISQSDWDSFETSWDFKKNPLI